MQNLYILFGRRISFLIECPLYYELRKIYIKPYYRKTLNIPKFIEPMTIENVTEIRLLSMYITKAFEIK